MSPEQAAGQIESLDTRTDIYSLGAILYTILTLTPPIRGDDPDEVLAKVRAGGITPPEDRVGTRQLPHLPGAMVPPGIAAVAMKALALDPEQRFSSVKGMQAALATAMEKMAAHAWHAASARARVADFTKRHWIAMAASAAVAAAITAGVMWSLKPAREPVPEPPSVSGPVESAREAEWRRSLRQASRMEYAAAKERLSSPLTWHEGLARLSRAVTWDPENAAAAELLHETLLHFPPEKRDWPRFILPHRDAVKEALFSPDGTKVLTSSLDGTARLWSAATGEPLTPPLQHEGAVTCGAFSPDGSRFATGGGDGAVRIWDAQSGRLLVDPMRHGGWVHGLGFSPDGKRLVTASSTRTARVWNAATGAAVGEPLRHKEVVVSANFSADGLRVITVGADQSVRSWDLATATAEELPSTNADGAGKTAVSADGKLQASAVEGTSVRIWATSENRQVGELLRQEGTIEAIAFSPDGAMLLTAGGDGNARLWPVSRISAVEDDAAPVSSDEKQARAPITPVPVGITAFAAAIAGLEFDDENVLRPVPAARRLEIFKNGVADDPAWAEAVAHCLRDGF
jgi:hypothetical protein